MAKTLCSEYMEHGGMGLIPGWGTSSVPGSSVGKESTCHDLGSIPGSGRSPGERKGYPLQYSGLENSMDGIVHGVAKSRTQLSDLHFLGTKSHILQLKILCVTTKI